MGKGKYRADLPALTVEELVAILREDPARAIQAARGAKVLGSRVRGSLTRHPNGTGTEHSQVHYDSWRLGIDQTPRGYIRLLYGAYVPMSSSDLFLSIPLQPLGDDPESALKHIEDAVDAAWRAAGWVLA